MLLRSFIVFAASFSAVAAQACSVPVFRYALDRWRADSYVLEVSTDDAKDEAVARFLRNFTDSTPLNLAPQRSKEGGPSRLGFPNAVPAVTTVWSGLLSSNTLPVLTESPARTDLVHRILAGETGVWVLVDSGERETDDRTAAALEKRLHYLEKAADIPTIDPDDPTSELGPGPALQVKFSVLRVRREDAAEQTFIKMLAGPKNETAPATGPWLALVFGRGRVLGAWPAEGFGNEQIDEACLFLLGACSCQVKRMNPGWDLLLNVDWDDALQAIGFPKGEVAQNSNADPQAKGSPETAEVAPVPATASNPGGVPPTEPAVKSETVTLTAPTPPIPQPGRGLLPGAVPALLALAMLLLGSFLAWRIMRR